MNVLLAILAVMFASPALSSPRSPLIRRALDGAASAGFPVPASFEPVPVAAPRASAVRSAASLPIYGPVSGYGYVEGTAFASCRQRHGDLPEYVSAQVPLIGHIEVSGPAGSRGSIFVQGSAYLSGWCRRGSVSLSGSAPVSGRGPLTLNGTLVGMAQVSGYVSIQHNGWDGSIRIRERATVSGYLSP